MIMSAPARFIAVMFSITILFSSIQPSFAAAFTIENMNCAPSLDWLAAQGYLGEITR